MVRTVTATQRTTRSWMVHSSSPGHVTRETERASSVMDPGYGGHVLPFPPEYPLNFPDRRYEKWTSLPTDPVNIICQELSRFFPYLHSLIDIFSIFNKSFHSDQFSCIKPPRKRDQGFLLQNSHRELDDTPETSW